jgi:predicted transcriptional regulator
MCRRVAYASTCHMVIIKQQPIPTLLEVRAMTATIQIHIGDTLGVMGERFIDAWHRAEQGELTPESPERQIGFETFELFAHIMTPRQLELLRHVHRHPPRSVRALSIALGRDYRRVPEDVEALVNAGLLDRDGTAPRADYDTVRTETSIAL